MKLPADRAGLPGNDLLFHIVPLDPAYPAKAGRGTLRPKSGALSFWGQLKELFFRHHIIGELVGIIGSNGKMLGK